jgi:hypothetical protein
MSLLERLFGQAPEVILPRTVEPVPAEKPVFESAKPVDAFAGLVEFAKRDHAAAVRLRALRRERTHRER